MKNIYFRIFIILLVFLIQTGLPFLAIAASIVPSCEGVTCKWADFETLIKNVLDYIITLAVLFAGLAIAWAGFLYLFAAGDEKKIGEAHDIFKKVVLGILWALAAYLVVKTILSVVASDSLKNKLK
ncbi:MAG: hypothetical protein H7831_08090 [Magnetococcus sp. WYHC-3]